jgi:probable O-glycosylation ligase (exosortase A-associated)
MCLPLLVYLAVNLPRKWMRLGVGVLIPMTALTVVFTHSRGGFLALAAVTLYMLARSKRRVAAAVMISMAVTFGTQFVSEEYYERLSTILNYESDGSAQGRLNAWEASYHMANDYPLVGVGLDNFTLLFQHYAPDPEDVHVAHNTYLQILAEAGYIGLILYLLLLVTALWSMESAGRKARALGYAWAESGARYLSASLVAFMVGGMFLNRAHFDLTYHVMILGACLLRILSHDAGWLSRHPRDRGIVPKIAPEIDAAAPAAVPHRQEQTA